MTKQRTYLLSGQIIQSLNDRAKVENKTQAELVRDALTEYLLKKPATNKNK